MLPFFLYSYSTDAQGNFKEDALFSDSSDPRLILDGVEYANLDRHPDHPGAKKWLLRSETGSDLCTVHGSFAQCYTKILKGRFKDFELKVLDIRESRSKFKFGVFVILESRYHMIRRFRTELSVFIIQI